VTPTELGAGKTLGAMTPARDSNSQTPSNRIGTAQEMVRYGSRTARFGEVTAAGADGAAAGAMVEVDMAATVARRSL
jgi:hypothetical protein